MDGARGLRPVLFFRIGFWTGEWGGARLKSSSCWHIAWAR
jgi:hypothetical protein